MGSSLHSPGPCYQSIGNPLPQCGHSIRSRCCHDSALIMKAIRSANKQTSKNKHTNTNKQTRKQVLKQGTTVRPKHLLQSSVHQRQWCCQQVELNLHSQSACLQGSTGPGLAPSRSRSAERATALMLSQRLSSLSSKLPHHPLL